MFADAETGEFKRRGPTVRVVASGSGCTLAGGNQGAAAAGSYLKPTMTVCVATTVPSDALTVTVIE